MRVIHSAIVLFAGLAPLIGAQTTTAQSAMPVQGNQLAVIEGDVYLVMRSGDVKKGAGREVRLIADVGKVAALLNANCAEYGSTDFRLTNRQKSLDIMDGRRKAVTDSIFANFEATTNRADRVLLAATVRTAGTGMNAHYRLTDVAPGRYALWAQFPIGDRTYQWFVPITVTGGETITKDLDNDAENGRIVYCGIR